MNKFFFIFFLIVLSACAAPQKHMSENSVCADVPIDRLFGHDSTITFLAQPAKGAFKKLQLAAEKDGLTIETISAYRSFEHQKRIWERKINARIEKGFSPEEAINDIIKYSTIPGTSRHHWGTEVDMVLKDETVLGDRLSAEKFHNGPYEPLRKWLEANAKKFSFYLVYTNDPKRKGFEYEPWHYSYKPLSQKYFRCYLSLNIEEKLSNMNIDGSENFSKTFVEKYIQQNISDINLELK